MSKKRDKKSLPSNDATMARMRDIANSNYISSAYYRTYLDALGEPNRHISHNNINSYSNSNPNNNAYDSNISRERTMAVGYKRRKICLFLIALFVMAILAVGVLGYLGNIVPEYVSAFNKGSGEQVQYLSLVDPVLGAVKKFAKVDTESMFYIDYFENMTDATIVDKVVAYAMPVAIALGLILSVIILLVALFGILKKGISKGYVAKKSKTTFLLFLVFICSLIVTVGAVFWNGEGLGQIVPFFTQSAGNINAGYGLFAMVGLSFLGFFVSLFAFKKARR